MANAPIHRVSCNLDPRIARAPLNVNGFRVASAFLPSAGASGDFYALTARRPRRLSVVIGDACGRGAEGACMLHALVPKLAKLLGSVGSPARTLSILNACAARVLPIDRFVTAAVLELDAEHHSLTIANAGHVPVLVRSLGGTVACLGRASGPPLGVVANALYLDETTPLQRGDVVVLMTDGVLEAIETDLGRMRRFRRLLQGAPEGAEGVEQGLLAALDAAPLEDDATLLAIEVTEACQAIAPWVEAS